MAPDAKPRIMRVDDFMAESLESSLGGDVGSEKWPNLCLSSALWSLPLVPEKEPSSSSRKILWLQGLVYRLCL
jgi:hypothetical protein